MRILFLGTPEFAVPSLEALVRGGHTVAAVYTQPDRPKGRGAQLAASPVKQAALRLDLPVLQPERIRHTESQAQLREFRPDMMVLVGYGQIVPQAVIDIPRHGILNVHASLLPRYRGAAPIQWAIANGETETGVTIMRIDAGLDTGDMIRRASASIRSDETAPELSLRLATMGAEELLKTVAAIEDGTAVYTPQEAAEATLAPILTKADGRIDFKWPASKIHNRMRGFMPWPGAYSTLRGQTFHVIDARPIGQPSLHPPGTIFANGKLLFTACGERTTLELLEVQLEGRKRLTSAVFLNGFPLEPNELLGELP